MLLKCVLLLLCYHLLVGGASFTPTVYSIKSSAECGLYNPRNDEGLKRALKETVTTLNSCPPHNAVTDELVTVHATNGIIVSQNYLQLNVSNTCSKVKSIQYTCFSHDQGTASVSGTASYSWVDLVVLSSDGTEIYRQFRAYANAVANSTFQEHSGSYGEQDELVQKCAPGSTLILVLNAQYGQWSNTARSAELTVKYR